jgi:hypothetical protein
MKKYLCSSTSGNKNPGASSMNNQTFSQLILLLMLTLAVGIHAQALSAQTQSNYYCPMDADVHSDKPGNCPKCGMKLLKRSDAKKKVSSYSLPKRISFPKQTVDGFDVDVLFTPLSKPDSNATHTVDVRVKNHKTRTFVSDADCWFHITYPDGRNLMPHLQFTKDRYTGVIHLRQKGAYLFMAHVNLEEKNVTRVIEARLR